MTRNSPKPSQNPDPEALREQIAEVLRAAQGAFGADARQAAEGACAAAAAEVFGSEGKGGSASQPPIFAGGSAEENGAEAPVSRDALKYRYPEIVGTSPPILSVLSVLDRVIESDLPV